MHKITVTLELTTDEIKLLCENSLERVLNTAEDVCDANLARRDHEDAWICREDLALLKSLASHIWYTASGQALTVNRCKD